MSLGHAAGGFRSESEAILNIVVTLCLRWNQPASTSAKQKGEKNRSQLLRLTSLARILNAVSLAANPLAQVLSGSMDHDLFFCIKDHRALAVDWISIRLHWAASPPLCVQMSGVVT